MWLQRLLKINKTAQGGGAGVDLGVASDNVLGLYGQGRFFGDEANRAAPNREEQQLNRLRRKKNRKMLERQRKCRLSKDPKPLQ